MTGEEYRLRAEMGWAWTRIAEETGAPNRHAAHDRAKRWATSNGATWPLPVRPVGEVCYRLGARNIVEQGAPCWGAVAEEAGTRLATNARRGAELIARRRGWVWPARLDEDGEPVKAGGEDR